MKNINSILTVCIFVSITFHVKGQVDINSSGMMTIAAQTQDWDAGLRVKVATSNSCAYNLWSPATNADVSFFNGLGYMWCRLGGWFGSDSTMKRNV